MLLISFPFSYIAATLPANAVADYNNTKCNFVCHHEANRFCANTLIFAIKR